jgi:hypothetical protein
MEIKASLIDADSILLGLCSDVGVLTAIFQCGLWETTGGRTFIEISMAVVELLQKLLCQKV